MSTLLAKFSPSARLGSGAHHVLRRSDCRLAQVICHLARRYIAFAASNINIICPPVGIVLFLAMCT